MEFKSIPIVLTPSVVVGAPDLTNNQRNLAYFCQSKQYYNFTGVPITIVDRNGITIILPPISNNYDKDEVLIIREIYDHGSNVSLDARSLLSDVGSRSKLIYRTVTADALHRQHNPRLKYFDTTFSLNDFKEQGSNSVYLYNLDIVISTESGPLVPFHPFSEKGLCENDRFAKEETAIDEAFGLGIRIVDSAGHFGDRYVNINGRVYSIKAETDVNRPDGVYITSSGLVRKNGKREPNSSKRYEFNEVDNVISLYETREDAAHLGNEKLNRDIQFNELKNQLQENEIKLKQIKLEAEREKAEKDIEKQRVEQLLESERQKHEAVLRSLEETKQVREETFQYELNRLKEERAREEYLREQERNKRKDYYEERSYVRKDNSELIKFLPVIFSGVIAVTTILFTVNSKK